MITVVCNKTYSEIIDAINNGYHISSLLIININENSIIYSINDYVYSLEAGKIAFFGTIIDQIYSNSTTMAANGLIITYQSNNTIVLSSNILLSSSAPLTIGSYTYDGSSAVNIPVYDGTYTWSPLTT